MVSERDTALGVNHVTFEKGWGLEDLEKNSSSLTSKEKNPAWPTTHTLILLGKLSSLVSEKILCNEKHSNLPLKSKMIHPLEGRQAARLNHILD